MSLLPRVLTMVLWLTISVAIPLPKNESSILENRLYTPSSSPNGSYSSITNVVTSHPTSQPTSHPTSHQASHPTSRSALSRTQAIENALVKRSTPVHVVTGLPCDIEGPMSNDSYVLDLIPNDCKITVDYCHIELPSNISVVDVMTTIDTIPSIQLCNEYIVFFECMLYKLSQCIDITALLDIPDDVLTEILAMRSARGRVNRIVYALCMSGCYYKGSTAPVWLHSRISTSTTYSMMSRLSTPTTPGVDCSTMRTHCLDALGLDRISSVTASLCRDRVAEMSCHYHSLDNAGCFSKSYFNMFQTDVDVDTHISIACELISEQCHDAAASCDPDISLPSNDAISKRTPRDAPDITYLLEEIQAVTYFIYAVCGEPCMYVMTDRCPKYAKLYANTFLEAASLPRTVEHRKLLLRISKSCSHGASFMTDCVDEQLYSKAFSKCIKRALTTNPVNGTNVTIALYTDARDCVHTTVSQWCNAISAEMVLDVMDLNFIYGLQHETVLDGNNPASVAMSLSFVFMVVTCITVHLLMK